MRDEVLATARDLYRLSLVEGTAGNVSARLGDETVCVTPRSLSYEEMTVDDLVVVDLAGVVVSGRHPPSSELALHLACYRTFPEVGESCKATPLRRRPLLRLDGRSPCRWTSLPSMSAARSPSPRTLPAVPPSSDGMLRPCLDRWEQPCSQTMVL